MNTNCLQVMKAEVAHVFPLAQLSVEINQGSGFELPVRIRAFKFSRCASLLDKPPLLTEVEVCLRLLRSNVSACYLRLFL